MLNYKVARQRVSDELSDTKAVLQSGSKPKFQHQSPVLGAVGSDIYWLWKLGHFM